jgi:Glycosyl transferase family 2/Methyltransferase domain
MTRRRLEFSPTVAVESARRRGQYIDCPACGSQSQRYLFHRTGVRFVRCRACDLVYADPIDPTGRAYFDIRAVGQHDAPVDRRHTSADFAALLSTICDNYERQHGRRPERVLVIGRWHPDFTAVGLPDVEVTLAAMMGADETRLVTHALTESLGSSLAEFDVVLLHEFLEAAHEPAKVLEGVSERLKPDAIVAVAFANMHSIPSRLLRRRWKSFFDKKIAFYNADNLETLMWRAGFRRLGNELLTSTYSLGYLAARMDLAPRTQRLLARSGLARLSGRVASGREIIFFAPSPLDTAERLSIIVPVYNEERYVRDVIEALLAKELPIEREIIIVESNSADSSRAIVRSFQGEPAIRIVYQDRPRGKGNAVRAALEVASGTIVLIQDADFEYDLDDYDGLLEPILQRRASFVLGSRSLGLDDWKVRRYATSRIKGVLTNLAQVVFAKSFNLLYQQNVTDINTMLKVFRRECIEGCHLDGDGFSLDIELVCKIVRNGFAPLEVPVNYVARGYDEGKKINFLDAYPSYFALLRCRFGRL